MGEGKAKEKRQKESEKEASQRMELDKHIVAFKIGAGICLTKIATDFSSVFLL